VTEYQAECATCPFCKTDCKASFPSDASRKAQYGSRFRAMLVYLNQYQLIPYNRTCEFMQDIFNINISEGTLYNTIKSCYKKTEVVEDSIKNQIINSFAAGFDESGAYCKGKRHWYHVARTENLTFFGVHEKRGRIAMDSFGILPNFKGAAIHDFYSSYQGYPSKHFLCNAHLLRELIFELEEKKQEWVKPLINLLTESNKEIVIRKKQGRKSVSKAFSMSKSKAFDAIIKKGLKINPRMPGKPNQRGRPAQSSARNLLERLRDFKNSYLEFMNDFRIPFDNNGSERDIRMLKVQQKISGCFRSNEGAAHFARIRGYISTSRKNDINILDALTGVFTGSPYIPVATT
jgi:transposase